MNKEELTGRLEPKRNDYYDTKNMLYTMREKLNSIKYHKGISAEFKGLIIALDVFENQVDRDFRRFENMASRHHHRDKIKQLQQYLNRERKLREQLQNRIDEAKESSGLFIKYVRSMLKS